MYTKIHAFVALTASLSVVVAQETGPGGLRKDPIRDYLEEVCRPIFTNRNKTDTSANDIFDPLEHSPFPCEQQLYISSACYANGTTSLDFEAQQQCICNGGYWENSFGCQNCYASHGVNIPGAPSHEVYMSYLTQLSSVYCSNTAFQPYESFLPALNTSTLSLIPPYTISSDPFPNATATSNYFTATGKQGPGKITGSATARLMSYTNYEGKKFTPTATPSGFPPIPTQPTGAKEGTETSGGAGVAGSGSPSTTKSGNAAVETGVGMMKAMMAVIGIGAVLI